MIVRILHEGQFEIDGEALDQVNDLDLQLVEAVAAGDEKRFHGAFKSLLEAVRNGGNTVPLDDVVESDVILPPADSSLAEVQELFASDGLVPG